MAEYIECESVDNVLTDLLGDIENDEECSCEFARGFERALSCVEDKVKDIPAADVRPERHGRWILDDSDEYANHFHCSRCGAEKDTCNEIYVEPPPPYCEHCGAKMDGKDVESDG